MPVVHLSNGQDYDMSFFSKPSSIQIVEAFRIVDGKIKTGRTQTRLAALAIRRVETKIDATLRAAKAASQTQQK